MEIPTTEAINGLRFRYISMMKKTLTAWVLAAVCLVSCASLRVEEKKSWSNSSPKSIGE